MSQAIFFVKQVNLNVNVSAKHNSLPYLSGGLSQLPLCISVRGICGNSFGINHQGSDTCSRQITVLPSTQSLKSEFTNTLQYYWKITVEGLGFLNIITYNLPAHPSQHPSLQHSLDLMNFPSQLLQHPPLS